MAASPNQLCWMLPCAAILLFGADRRAEADVTLRLSQSAYEVGEPVLFRLTNETDCVITLLDASAWWGVEDAQGNRVGGCYHTPITVDVYPGYSVTGNWDQRICPEGPQVLAGRYRLTAYYHCPWCYEEGCPEPSLLEALFDIGVVPVEPTSWGRIKAVLRGD